MNVLIDTSVWSLALRRKKESLSTNERFLVAELSELIREGRARMMRSPFLGQLFEGFVAAEILKSQVNQGNRKELYYFRDQQGLEVDFLLPLPNAGLWLIECKAGKTVRPAMAGSLLALRRTLGKRRTRLIVVHGKSRSAQVTKAVASGVEAVELERFVASLRPNH